MNIGALARRHGTTALLGLAIAGFGTATALAGSAPLPNDVATATPALTATAVATAKAAPLKTEQRKLHLRRQARAVPFFAFPPRI